MGHHHHHHGLNRAFWLALVFAVVELAGGWISHSLALLADAAHMLSDVAALALALWAGRMAQRPAHAGMSYGYGRAKILAALVNAGMLLLLAVWIVWEAAGRLSQPPQVQGSMVVWIAATGLLINLVMMKWMHGGHDINTRAAYWHVVGDALGSVAALLAGVVMVTTGWMLIDPLLSCLVAVILAWGGWKLVVESSLELMEASPEGLDIEPLQDAIRAKAGVEGVHHVHTWRLPSGEVAMSAHIQLADMQHWCDLQVVLHRLMQEYGIEHVTLQPEITCPDAQQHCIHAKSPHHGHEHEA